MDRIVHGTGSAKPFVLEDVQAKAKEILEEARRKAVSEFERILQTAREDAERLKKEADRVGREAGQRQGYEEGFAKGREAALAQVAQAWEKAASAAKAAVEGVQGLARDATVAAQEQVVRVALALAAAVVKRQVEIDPKVFEGNLKAALALCAEAARLRVHLHPDDLRTLQSGMEAFRPLLPASAEVEWVADASVGRGGALVRHEAGDLDARIASLLAEIERTALSAPGGKA